MGYGPNGPYPRRGLTNKQIGAALGISDRTVQKHLASIYAKLAVASRTEAVTAALQRHSGDLKICAARSMCWARIPSRDCTATTRLSGRSARRRRLARELHDEIVQELIALGHGSGPARPLYRAAALIDHLVVDIVYRTYAVGVWGLRQSGIL
jgi:signal transduction histidine kinase